MLPELRSLEDIVTAVEAGKQSGKLLLLKFGAHWCKPCQIIAPLVEHIVKANSEQLLGYEVDVDVVKESLTHFNVHKLPTFIMLDNGNVDRVWTGGDFMALENNVYNSIEAKENRK